MKKILIIFLLAAFGVAQGQTFSTLLRDKTKEFNIKDYGAVSDDGTQDVIAINRAIRAAVDTENDPYGGATVVIPAGIWQINDTINLRSGISVMLDRNAVLYAPEYSGAVFVADSTIANCSVTGGRIISDENTLTGISIRANALGHYTQKCEFSNIEIKGCLTGIAFYTDNSGFINANDFYNIWIDDFVNGITAYEGASSTGLSGNYFSNLTMQCDNATAYGLKDIDLSYSTFTNLFIWDLPVTATAAITVRNGSRNVFIGGNWSSTGFADTGLKNIYINGNSASSGFLNTGNIVAATGITSAMLWDHMLYTGSSAVNITANPQIAAGKDAQEITIVGSSDTNTLTLNDSRGLLLNGQCVLGLGDVITLVFNKQFNLWIEQSPRSDN